MPLLYFLLTLNRSLLTLLASRKDKSRRVITFAVSKQGDQDMNKTVKLTSKRQATFPVQLCQNLGVKAGDDLVLERKKIGDEIAWLLKPRKKN